MNKTLFLRGSDWVLTHYGVINHQKADSVLYRSKMNEKEWLRMRSALLNIDTCVDLSYKKYARAIIKMGEIYFVV